MEVVTEEKPPSLLEDCVLNLCHYKFITEFTVYGNVPQRCTNPWIAR